VTVKSAPKIIVIGSGAGGATTALTLAQAGLDVLVLEEGGRFDLSDYGRGAPEAMEKLYRRRGMTPIEGPVPIGYVEGCCVGGSTEINSGFWHRTPPEILLRWKARYDLVESSASELAEHFDWAEELVGVSLLNRPYPKSTEVFKRGIERMNWSAQEVPRAAPGCRDTNLCASGCPTGAKRGMSRTLIPAAEKDGATVLTNTRALLLLSRAGRISGVVAEQRLPGSKRELLNIAADAVFVCAGPTETPALLMRSGIKFHVGNNLRVHPMLKVSARFPEAIDAHKSVLPVMQVKEFWPEISLGGAYSSPGHLAMNLSENWLETKHEMSAMRHFASYYVAVRGTGIGVVRPSAIGEYDTSIRYRLSDEDHLNLSKGLARLATLLLAAGAEAVFPGVHDLPIIKTDLEAIRWLDERLPLDGLALTTVHAFSACPIGQNERLCAADSFGQVYRFKNLYINDASMLPDSPGVNPQGSIMALARRNALRFVEEQR
jgi:choline dehydrogenase-like flavoprotein